MQTVCSVDISYRNVIIEDSKFKTDGRQIEFAVEERAFSGLIKSKHLFVVSCRVWLRLRGQRRVYT